MLVRILICDDEMEYVSLLKKHIAAYMSNHCIHYQIDATTSILPILQTSSRYDLAFLDIQMPDVNGIEVAKELKKRNPKIVIFFVTSYNEYQDDAMDLRVFRFFVKPFDVERLYSGLDRAMEYINDQYVDIYLKSNGTTRRILVDDIMYIERINRKVFVYLKNEDFPVSNHFEELCQSLPNTFFYLVHKSIFVNLHYIDMYNYSELYLYGGTRIPIASRKQSAFHKYWFAYLSRR